MSAALLCIGRKAVGKSAKSIVGVHSEMTFWPNLADTLEVASRLAWPQCGPRCVGGVHLLAWRSGDRCRVLDLTTLDLGPRKRRELPTVTRKCSREAHLARTVEKFIAGGYFNLAAAVLDGEMTANEAQGEYARRRRNH